MRLLSWCFKSTLCKSRSARAVSAVMCWRGMPQLLPDPDRLPPEPSPAATLRPLPSPTTGLPRYPHHLSDVLCPVPRRTERLHVSISSPSARPSPCSRRVGVRIFTFEACSGFTHVTARRIARPPKAAFVAGLRPGQLPIRVARQLPDLSTTFWVEPSSTGDTYLRGAR